MGDVIFGNKEVFNDKSRKIVIYLPSDAKYDKQSECKPEDNSCDYVEYEEEREDEPRTAQKEIIEGSTQVTKPEIHPDLSPEDMFVNMVKKIVTKAAEKNNHTIEAKPNGRLTPYIYYIDAVIICKVLDDLRDNYPQYILNVLNNSSLNFE